jgi:hypothetical protein
VASISHLVSLHTLVTFQHLPHLNNVSWTALKSHLGQAQLVLVVELRSAKATVACRNQYLLHQSQTLYRWDQSLAQVLDIYSCHGQNEAPQNGDI